jgi:hypothetical protein
LLAGNTLRSAMSTNEAFTNEVTQQFRFLEEDYGMRREPAAVSGGGHWLIYGNVNVRVVIEAEVGGTCGVTVQNLRFVKKDPLERNEFDLDEIVATAAGPRQPRRPEPRTMQEAVARAAQTLKTVGAPVLNGDFEALHARQKKAVEVLRRHHPLQDDKEPAKDC